MLTSSSVPYPINIASNSQNPTEALLSNLAHTPFVLDGRGYASVEAFWQWLKYSNKEERERIAWLSGIESKKVWNNGDNADHFEYEGVMYRVWSEEHQNLMRRAIRAKLEQNSNVLSLLLSTGNTPIIHDPKRKDGTSYPDSTTIPARVFSQILMDIREDLQFSVER
jgi:predicted NAD-dependent protein-ADP-ribosyltransferase YbiA (DUF1768 family)